MEVKIINKSNNPLPKYATLNSAGMDIRANLDAPVCIKKGQVASIPTGLYIELPMRTEAQIRSRSGLALNNTVSVLNSPGTIDPDYRGEIKVILINHSQTDDFWVNHGDRIAQMIISSFEHAEFVTTNELTDTVRGTGGFGSTGKM